MSRESSHDAGGRRLIYFPIIHTQADMGAMEASIRQAGLYKLGEKGWKRKDDLVDILWVKIEQVIENLDLPYEKVRLYQDGLPICQRESEIAREIAKSGSKNHQILVRLMEKGAILMGTESSELLIQEYELLKQVLGVRDSRKATRIAVRQKDLSDSLLARRDQFISHRINSTLRPGETGILFLGMLHSLERWLDKDIRIIYPITQPVASGGKKNVKGKPPYSNR